MGTEYLAKVLKLTFIILQIWAPSPEAGVQRERGGGRHWQEGRGGRRWSKYLSCAAPPFPTACTVPPKV